MEPENKPTNSSLNVKETPQNLPPTRLGIGTCIIGLDRGVTNHINSYVRGIAHGDTREHQSYKKIFNDSFHNNP